MPQIGKGGKFIFGWSIIKADRTIQIPDQAVEEYQIMIDKKGIPHLGQ